MKKLFILMFLIGSIESLKADDIALGVPGYGGNGCPAGSAAATLSPDKKSLSILFDEFIVEAGGDTGKRIARKSCNIAVPVHVPQGLSVSILTADYRGYVSLPRGAKARFSAEYFFAGKRGPRYQKRFYGYKDQDYLIENKLALTALTWSKCGEDVNLRINSSMLIRTNRYRDEALSTVDSADLNAGIIFKLAWKKCRY